MTPAIHAAEKAGIVYTVLEYEHEPGVDSYGEEAARQLDRPPEQVFKTLVAKLDASRLAVAVLPVPRRLDLKALAAALGAKRAAMAEPKEAERATGYVVGGISPLGQRRRLPMALDASAEALPRICVSAGRRGLDIELAPADLMRLCGAKLAPIAR